MAAVLAFLASLHPRRDWVQSAAGPTEYTIEDVLTVERHTIVNGLVCHGIVKTGQVLLLGPDLLGGFSPVLVHFLQSNRIPVQAVTAGHLLAVSLVTESGTGQFFLGHGERNRPVSEVCCQAGQSPLASQRRPPPYSASSLAAVVAAAIIQASLCPVPVT